MDFYYDRDLFQVEGVTLVKYIGGDQEIVEIPEGIEIIGEEAFACLQADIDEIVLPSTIKHIRRSAFESSGVSRINLPEGLISIGDCAFSETYLCDIELPSTLVRIGKSVFAFTELISIAVSPNNPYFELRGEGLFDVIEREIITGFGDFVLAGNDIEAIAADAFQGKTCPDVMYIPEGVKRIGSKCFAFCAGVEEVVLPSTLVSIGEAAFSSCKSLRKINLPSTLTTIPERAFSGCSNFFWVSIPDSIIKIEKGAFLGCKSLMRIDIPQSVKIIQERAFGDNDLLEAIYCEAPSKPDGWSEDWNINAEWSTTFMGRPVHGGINTKVHWGYTFEEDYDDLFGLDCSFDNEDVMIDLIGAHYYYCDDVCVLIFDVENKTGKSMRIWMKKLGIFSKGGEEEEVSKCDLIVSLDAYESDEVTFVVDEGDFDQLSIAPSCMIKTPYSPDICCSALSFEISYDFGSTDVDTTYWEINNFEVDIMDEYDDEDEDDDDVEEDVEFTADTVLYIYKGNIRCHRYGHNILQATALLHNRTDNEIALNVEYCTNCKKYLLEYTLFEQYRQRYGMLVGNFRMVVNGEFEGEYDLAEESPLMLSGYNVSQRDGYTSQERHYILARIMHDRIMDKGEVIRYLSYFIRKNGARRGNELALSKWREDLSFVQSYDLSIQPRTIITDIRKY